MATIQASFSIARSESSTVVKITGKANCNCTENFVRVMDEEIKRGCRSFILDLSECPIMDSSFLGTLVHEVEKTGSLPEGGIRVELFDAPPRILELMEDLGAFSLFGTLNTDVDPPKFFTPVLQYEVVDKLTLLKNSIRAHETLLEGITKPDKKAAIESLLKMLREELKELEKRKIIS